MTGPAFFTICSKNYLHYAVTLADSFAEKNDEPFFIFVCDRDLDEVSKPLSDYRLVALEDLPLPEMYNMALRYNVMEMNTAIKPTCFKYLFAEGYDKAVYLDPDIFVTDSFAPVIEKLQDNDAVLTPHLRRPFEDDFHPGVQEIHDSGLYNLGFGAFADRPQARAFIDWWERRCIEDCYSDIDSGLFVDQKFADFAPCFIESCHISHHPGLNVAYWNLHDRKLSRDGGLWRADGKPLIFFHFSGVVKDDLTIFSKHQDRYTVKTVGEIKEAYLDYMKRLRSNAKRFGVDFSTLPYAFNSFSDGSPLLDPHRWAAREYLDPAESDFETLFAPDSPLFTATDRHLPLKVSGLRISQLLGCIWRRRADLTSAFDMKTPEGQRALIRWFLGGGAREYRIDNPGRYASWDETGAAALKPVGGQVGVALRQSILHFYLRNRSCLGPLVGLLPDGLRHRLRAFLLAPAQTSEDGPRSPSDKLHGDLALPLSGSKLRDLGQVDDAGLAEGIEVYGYLDAPSGVGRGGQAAIGAFEAAGLAVAPRRIRSAEAYGRKGSASQAEPPAAEYSIVYSHMNADETRFYYERLALDPADKRLRVGYWAWELPYFPEAWRVSTGFLHDIWVPSRFVAEALERSYGVSAAVVPHPVVVDRGDAMAWRTRLGIPAKAFVVLTTFDFNSYPSRKNAIGAVRAFFSAFPEDEEERSCMILKVHGSHNRENFFHEIETAAGGSRRLKLVDQTLSDQEMGDLQEACDVFLSLHRSEGFGLNIAECMARGKAVVATDYSGNRDFMTPSNSVPIGYKLIAVDEKEYPMSQGQWWADPNQEEAIKALRTLERDAELRATLGARAAEDIARNFSYEAVGNLCRERLESLLGRSLAKRPEPETPRLAVSGQ